MFDLALVSAISGYYAGLEEMRRKEHAMSMSPERFEREMRYREIRALEQAARKETRIANNISVRTSIF
jgi:hypothetical protein